VLRHAHGDRPHQKLPSAARIVAETGLIRIRNESSGWCILAKTSSLDTSLALVPKKEHVLAHFYSRRLCPWLLCLCSAKSIKKSCLHESSKPAYPSRHFQLTVRSRAAEAAAGSATSEMA